MQTFHVSHDSLFDSFAKLLSVKSSLNNIYYKDFVSNLRECSVNRPGRYKSVKHSKLAIGDLVVVRQSLSKPYMYPMGIITNIEINDLDEVVTASLRKSNGEIIRRHASDLVLLESAPPPPNSPVSRDEILPHTTTKAKRKAAIESLRKNAELYNSNLV